MTETIEADLDQRISRIVSALLREERADEWLDAQRAADHLKMSRHHFLRLCRNGEGPEGCGDGRLKRWRRSILDIWQESARSGRDTLNKGLSPRTTERYDEHD